MKKFIFKVNERMQDFDNGGGGKMGKNKRIWLSSMRIYWFSFKAELQKALNNAEEQMKNVKVIKNNW